MTRKWKRIIRLSVSGSGGSLDLSDLKIEFSVTKTLGSKQNEATISVWNLTKAHRQQLGEEFDKAEIEIGYEGSETAIIFKGTIRDVEHEHEDTDIRSTMECADGDEGFAKGTISKTFPRNTDPKEMVKELVKSMPKVQLGEMKGLDNLPKTKRPTSFYGWSWRELDELGRQHSFYWSVQNGKFEAVKNDEVLSGIVIISKDTGMVGIPKVTDKGVNVKCLADPKIAPGRTIDVRSNFLDEGSGRDKRGSDAGGGLFRVASVTFSGGNRQNEYYAEVEGNRIQGGKVKK